MNRISIICSLPQPLDSARKFQRRFGTTTIELLVAFSLLTTVLSVSVPLVVRHGRVLTSARQYRLALDELSNQLERLTMLPAAQLQAEIDRLTPSDFAAARLPGAKLRGRLSAAEVGQRLTLELVWEEPQRGAAPVKLAAWIPPDLLQKETPASDGEAAREPKP